MGWYWKVKSSALSYRGLQLFDSRTNILVSRVSALVMFHYTKILLWLQTTKAGIASGLGIVYQHCYSQLKFYLFSQNSQKCSWILLILVNNCYNHLPSAVLFIICFLSIVFVCGTHFLPTLFIVAALELLKVSLSLFTCLCFSVCLLVCLFLCHFAFEVPHTSPWLWDWL